MPRRPRIAPGGLVYQVLNRAVARLRLFEKDADYAAFKRAPAKALEKHPMRLLAYTVMPQYEFNPEPIRVIACPATGLATTSEGLAEPVARGYLQQARNS